MNDTFLLTAQFASILLAVCLLGRSVLQMRRYALSSIHATSCFPVFAVRDRARMAVIRQQADPGDRHWQLLHEALNSLLHIENRSDMVKFMTAVMDERLKEIRDPKREGGRKQFEQELMAAREHDPKLDTLYRQADAAVPQMLSTRTTWLSIHGFRLRPAMLRRLLSCLLACTRFGLVAVRAFSMSTRLSEVAWNLQRGKLPRSLAA